MSMTSYFTFNIMHFENLHPCEELSMKSKWSKKIGEIVFLMSWARFTGFTLLKRLKLWDCGNQQGLSHHCFTWMNETWTATPQAHSSHVTHPPFWGAAWTSSLSASWTSEVRQSVAGLNLAEVKSRFILTPLKAALHFTFTLLCDNRGAMKSSH